MNRTSSEQLRFASKWQKQGRCHVWTGPLDRDGYGTFYFRHKNRRAHRVAWFFCHGDLAADAVINHTCRNRACVNPQHLQVITSTENVLRNSTSGPYLNSQKTHCPLGHPYDRSYTGKRGTVRYCSICNAAKQKRLRAKWTGTDKLNV